MKTISQALQEQFGEKIYKLSLSSGCTCPTRDGTLGWGGCTFCSEGGSGEYAQKPAPIEEQIEKAKALIAPKTNARRFIAYFQSFTNTYGDVERLRKLYLSTIQREDIQILSLGTRPDCLGPKVMDMLRELNAIKPVWIELGLQTIHEETAQKIHRGYDLATFEEAYFRLKEAKIGVIVHVIFGLPGETRKQMLETVDYLTRLCPPPDGIKLQMLCLLKGTAMGQEYEKDPWPLLSLEEYASLVAESVHKLPKETVIHRLSGDPPRRLLLAPEWTVHKKKVLNTLWKEINKEEGIS